MQMPANATGAFNSRLYMYAKQPDCICRDGKLPFDRALERGMEDRLAIMHHTAAAAHRAAGTVSLSQHRGLGLVSLDHNMHFEGFNTFVADVTLCGGCFYFELQAKSTNWEYYCDKTYDDMLGFCTNGFEACKQVMPRSEQGSLRSDPCCWGIGVNMRCSDDDDTVFSAFKLHAGDPIDFGIT